MLSVICLISLFLLRDHPRLLAFQRGATDLVAVTAEVILAPVDGWNRLVQSFQSRAFLQDEVFRLQQENRVLKGQTQRLVSLLSENARYKALLNSARDIEDELVAACNVSSSKAAKTNTLAACPKTPALLHSQGICRHKQ